MTAKADGSVKAGIWALDNAGGSWHAINSGGASSATYEYQSSIKCDGTYQPGEPALSWLANPNTTPPANKFAPGPAGQMLDIWRRQHTGVLGSLGKTQADGNSYVDKSRWNERYVCDIFLTALAKPAVAAAGDAVARSWASDPWTFRLRKITQPGWQAVVGIKLRLRGRFRGNGGSANQADAVRVRGDMGSLDIEAPGPAGKPLCKAVLAPGWRVYSKVRVLRAGKYMAVPKALTAKQVVQLLKKSVKPSSNGQSLGFGADLTFVKAAGANGGSLACGLSIMASEAGAGKGEPVVAPGWDKARRRQSARRKLG